VVRAGDIAGLLERFVQLREKTRARTGRVFPFVVIQEAGLDGFWIDRALQNEGVDVERHAGCRRVQNRPSSREDADEADVDKGALSASAHDEPEPGRQDLSYLLRGVEITRPNQVWAMDMTYIPMARGFVYLAVVLDLVQPSRAVVAGLHHDGDGVLRRDA